MSRESRSSYGESYVRPENQLLLDQLEKLNNDPHGALMVIQEAMEIDVASNLGFRGWNYIKDPESFRSEQLSADQYETIKSFEEMVKVFSRYGVLSPAQQGLWFTSPNEKLNNTTPLHSLFFSVEKGQFDRQVVKEVIGAAAPFLKPEQEGGYQAFWSLWND